MKNFVLKKTNKNRAIVSVTIPAHNSSETLKECLTSVLKQSYQPKEIIVVDNNSQDNTKEIILNFQKKYGQKIKYVFEKTVGRAAARNAGISKAQGEIIAMIDSDCIAPPNWLEKLIAPIEKEKENAVMGFEKSFTKNYWADNRQKEDELFTFSKFDGKYIEHIDTKNFAIKTHLIKKFMFNQDLVAYEDWDLFLRLKKCSIKIRFLPDVIVYHQHNSSFKSLVKTQYERGKCAKRIISTYSKDHFFNNYFKSDASAKSCYWKNFIFFLPWAILQFFLNPKSAPFKIISDLSWKIGILSETIHNFATNIKSFYYYKKLNTQMKTKEISFISKSIRPPFNILVFGVGNDSILWHKLNLGGKTVFLEDDETWIQTIQKKFPFLEIYKVSYNTLLKNWKHLLNHPQKLKLNIPSHIFQTSWDIIIVDGPMGYSPQKPGRMKSIYMASILAKKGGFVFVHDLEREVEKNFCHKYLGEKNLLQTVKGRALLGKFLTTF